MSSLSASVSPAAAADRARFTLAQTRRGDRGVVVEVGAEGEALDHGVSRSELERRLLEIGFVEGARFEILHEGLIGRDPIAVRLDDIRVALRRREAGEIRVRLDQPDARSR